MCDFESTNSAPWTPLPSIFWIISWTFGFRNKIKCTVALCQILNWRTSLFNIPFHSYCSLPSNQFFDPPVHHFCSIMIKLWSRIVLQCSPESSGYGNTLLDSKFVTLLFITARPRTGVGTVVKHGYIVELIPIGDNGWTLPTEIFMFSNSLVCRNFLASIYFKEE